MDETEMVRQIAVLGRCLNGLARESSTRARMMQPRIGDLVVETTRFMLLKRDRFDPDAVGYLRDIVLDTYHIEPLLKPGHIVRWHNAEFIALPTESANRFFDELVSS